MIKFIVPLLSNSGHLFDISIEFRPYVGKEYADPCIKKCFDVAEKEYHQIANDIRQGLKLLQESKLKG